MSLELSIREKVLLTIARKRDKTHYELWKKDNVAGSNKTVIDVLSDLETRNLIKSKKEKTGRKRKFYNITIGGLLSILECKQSFMYIDEIAGAQKDMAPLIFGKWYFFQKEGITNEVIKRLKIAVIEISNELDIICYLESIKRKSEQASHWDFFEERFGGLFKEKTREGQKGVEEALHGKNYPQQKLLTTVIFPPLKYILDPQEQTEFMSHLKEDSDLSRFIKEQLDEKEKEYADYLNNIKSWKTWWKSLEKKSM